MKAYTNVFIASGVSDCLIDLSCRIFQTYNWLDFGGKRRLPGECETSLY